MCAIGEKEPAFFWVTTGETIQPLEPVLCQDIISLRATEEDARTKHGEGHLATFCEGELKKFFR